MTVSTEVNHEQYDGNGTTTVFPFRFRILKSSHMVVTVSDPDAVLSTLLLGTDYTLNGVGQINGGTVVLAKPLALGWRMSLDRSLPAVQETDLRNQGRFFAETHEDAFDYLTMLIQQALSVFGLGLKKPSWVADFYDALGNRISNLGAPKSGGDATNKSYVDTQNLKNIRVPENTVAATPSVADRQNKLFAWDNQGNPIAVIPQDGSASDVLIELQKPTGSNLTKVPTGETLTSYLSTSRGIDPRMPPHNYRDSDTIEQRTASLQSAFNMANATGIPVFLSGKYTITKLSLPNHSEYSVIGSSVIICQGSGNAALEMVNCLNIKWVGYHTINCSGDFNFGVHVYANNASGTSLLALDITVTYAPTAFKFGHESYPDYLVSEIVVRGGSLYGCRHGALIYGAQTVIEFNGYQLIVSDFVLGSHNNQVGIATVVGGMLHINGGECMMANSPNGWAFTSKPIDSPMYDNSYGSIVLVGSALESAGLWFYAYNPSGVTNVEPKSGCMIFSGVTGYTSFQDFLLRPDAGFTGKIAIDANCKFHCSGQRNKAVLSPSGGAMPDVYIDDAAFEKYFLKGFANFNGGILHFSDRQIVKVTNLSGQQSTVGTPLVLVFKSLDSVPENAFYGSPYYSTTTGKFTIPPGGLKSVKVHFEGDFTTALPTSELLLIRDDSTAIGRSGIAGRFVNADFYLGDLPEGATICLRLHNQNTNITFDSANTNLMIITCRN
ncbi:hypothetical protein [Pantoea ananatis]